MKYIIMGTWLAFSVSCSKLSQYIPSQGVLAIVNARSSQIEKNKDGTLSVSLTGIDPYHLAFGDDLDVPVNKLSLTHIADTIKEDRKKIGAFVGYDIHRQLNKSVVEIVSMTVSNTSIKLRVKDRSEGKQKLKEGTFVEVSLMTWATQEQALASHDQHEHALSKDRWGCWSYDCL